MYFSRKAWNVVFQLRLKIIHSLSISDKGYFGIRFCAILSERTSSLLSEPVKMKIVQDKSYKNDAHDNKGTYGYHIQFIRKEEPATLHIR